MAPTLVEQDEEKDGTEVIGLVQRSFLASPQVYKVMEIGASVGSVTHNEKFTFPSPSVSNRAQASSVLFPLTVVSSQFHSTVREVGSPAVSTHRRVRSFCPGSSLAPAVSFVQLSTARAEENVVKAIPSARMDPSMKSSMNREDDLFISDDLLERLLNDENINNSLFMAGLICTALGETPVTPLIKTNQNRLKATNGLQRDSTDAMIYLVNGTYLS